MSEKTPEDIWYDMCDEWEVARRNTSAATRKAFKGGWLQQEGVAELNAAYEEEKNIRKRMDAFLKRHC